MQSHEGTYCARKSPKVDPTYWDMETSRDLSSIQVNLVLTFFPSSASILTFQGKNLASQLDWGKNQQFE